MISGAQVVAIPARGELRRDEAAGERWRAVYHDLSEGRPGLLGSMTGRAEAQTMRLACLYALADGASVIGVDHIEAALALWVYCFNSARFPSCENHKFNFAQPQKTWRTAWRSLVQESAKCAYLAAAKLCEGSDAKRAEAGSRAAEAFNGLRFHDLRHQAITELAESGAADATLMALAGHMSRAMMEHYSHVRMQAKRQAVECLSVAPPTVGDIPGLPSRNAVN